MAQITIGRKSLKRQPAWSVNRAWFNFRSVKRQLRLSSAVVGDNEEELDLICAFDDKPSQTLAQLVESSGFSEEKIDQLATSLAKKGLIFNQPSSSGVMIYRLLPLMLVGLMEYKFMVELSGSQEEKELAGLFEKLLEELKDQIQDNYETLAALVQFRPGCGSNRAQQINGRRQAG